MSDTNEIRFDVAKKQTVAPPVDVVPEDPKRGELRLTPWPDGQLVKHAPNPAKPGTYLLVDGARAVVALAGDVNIANLLCRAVDLFSKAVAFEAERQAKVPTPDNTPEAALKQSEVPTAV